MLFAEHYNNGVYTSPHNGKQYVSAKAFSAHMRSKRMGLSSPLNAKFSCIYCKTSTGISNFERHFKSCHLNPINLRLCEVCNSPIKNFKENQTCSYSCSNTLFRSGPNNPNWKDTNYRSTCFHYHKKECVVCGEHNIVEVHHLDEDHSNNNPENLIPLCPTHHQYWHSTFKSHVETTVLEYINAWKAQH